MGLNSTLNGLRVVDARVTIPAWGLWYADATVDGDKPVTGAVDLVVADLALKGTVLSGGVTNGRTHVRIVAGAGGWGKAIKANAWANDAEVKASTGLLDAAKAAGETIDAATVPTSRVGSHFARKGNEPASRSLQHIAPEGWYVGEDGITRIGKRAPSTLPANVTRESVDRARGVAVLASDSIAKILPGVDVDGLVAVDVEHTISAEGGLRSTIWGARGDGLERRLSVWRRIVNAVCPQLPYLGTWEYRIVEQAGARLALEPVRVSTGMPNLELVPVRPGVAGMASEHKLGARCLVIFIDGQPARPSVVALEDEDGSGFKPIITTIDAQTLVKLGAGALPVARAGDLAGGIWPIAPTQVKVLA